MAINPNTPFVRQQIDLPTDVALAMEAAAKAAGVSKRKFAADAITAACAQVTTKKKGK